MTVKFHEVMQPPDGLDKHIVGSAKHGQIEWDAITLERANHWLTQHRLYASGVCAPLSEQLELLDIPVDLEQPVRVRDCAFRVVWHEGLHSTGRESTLTITGRVDGVGLAVLDLRELSTTEGKTFTKHFNSSPKRHG